MTGHGKLVRDGIPELIRADGRRPVVQVLPRERRRRALLDKLIEEAAEAAVAGPDELAEELADVLEVVRALAGELGVDLPAVLQLADRKRSERGGFDEGLFLVGVNLRPEDDRAD